MNPVQLKIQSVRNAIKWYIVTNGLLHGLGILLIGLSCLFLIDYLPVRFGIDETPWGFRAVVLAGLIAGACIAIFRAARSVLGEKISDDSIRLLIERKRPELNDRLLTMGLQDGPSATQLKQRQTEMLVDLSGSVEEQIEKIRVTEFFTFRPFAFSSLRAIIPLFLFAILFLLAPDDGRIGLQRNLLLANQNYPRVSEIIAIRCQVIHQDRTVQNTYPASVQDVKAESTLLIGKGNSLEIFVEVKYSKERHSGRRDQCLLFYKLDNGERGQNIMSRVRKTSDGNVVYVAKDNDLISMQSSGEFWIQAYDSRSAKMLFQVRQPPAIEKIEQEIEYPKYLVNNSIFKNGKTPFVNESRYPMGSVVHFGLVFDGGPIVDANISGQSMSADSERQISIDKNVVNFSHQITADDRLQVIVRDRDGISSTHPVQLALQSIDDLPPRVSVLPVGIGTEITGNAVIPLWIKAEDEFGVDGGTIKLTLLNQTKQCDLPFTWADEESKTIETDLAALSRAAKLELPIQAEENATKLKVECFVSDHHPDHPPSVGQSYVFTIVDEKKLVQGIERQEASLRQRLEAVAIEFSSSNGLFLAINREVEQLELNSNESCEQFRNSVPVFLQRIRLQCQKSSREISSIANALNELVQQLKNNRLKVKIKQLELSSKIESPLRTFAEIRLVEFLNRLLEFTEVSRAIGNGNLSPDKESIAAMAKAIQDQQARLSMELGSIIEQMVKYEDQSELLDSVRDLIELHQKVMTATKKERERKLFEGILD